MNIAASPAAIAGVSEAEWQIRCDLAALYRLVAYYRWTDFIYTHISARLPGPGHHFLINKYGVNFQEIRASDLVKIDLDGNVVEAGDISSRRVNAAGFTIHSAIHMARPDLMCVVHTHTAAGMAVSAMEVGGCRCPSTHANSRAASPIMITKASHWTSMNVSGW